MAWKIESLSVKPVNGIKICEVRDCGRECPAKPGGGENINGKFYYSKKFYSGSLCGAHQQRKLRLGSATARKCCHCKEIVDDMDHQETHLIETRKAWICDKCVREDPSRLDRAIRLSRNRIGDTVRPMTPEEKLEMEREYHARSNKRIRG